jgi:uridine nucleosidase
LAPVPFLIPRRSSKVADNSHQDTFAILLAAYHPGIRLLGISTVHGNASLDKTTKNALSVLASIGKDAEVAVYPGASQALYRAPIHAPTDIHGESGLDGTDLLPQPRVAARTDTSAIDAMRAAILAEEKDSVWVVATGAVTNIGNLFMTYPELKSHIKGLSIMGGSIGGGFTPAIMGKVDDVERIGNYTPWAEFNILIDPEAAAFVADDEILRAKLTLVPLDLTHLVLATAEVQEMLLHGNEAGDKQGVRGKTDLRVMLVELLNFFATTYR